MIFLTGLFALGSVISACTQAQSLPASPVSPSQQVYSSPVGNSTAISGAEAGLTPAATGADLPSPNPAATLTVAVPPKATQSFDILPTLDIDPGAQPQPGGSAARVPTITLAPGQTNLSLATVELVDLKAHKGYTAVTRLRVRVIESQPVGENADLLINQVGQLVVFNIENAIIGDLKIGDSFTAQVTLRADTDGDYWVTLLED